MRRGAEKEDQTAIFPLAMNPFGQDEILAMTEVLLTGRLTMGSEVEKVERKFAQMIGVPYAVMVNSGSSANLLAVSAIANKLRPIHCSPGDQVIVPAVCWSTSVFPLLQNGLCPVFVDADPQTLNMDIAALERKITPRVKAIVAVHVLGNAVDMKKLMKIVENHNLMLIEDTCESLGSFWQDQTKENQKMLGTFGDFGTFSFYFSHHITSGEGGMVTCKTEEDYNFIRCLRAHGWTRHLTNRQSVEESYPDIDSRFLFINVGYNLRPLEVQAAMLNVQLDKLHLFNEHRRNNLKLIKTALSRDERFSRVMSIMEASSGVDPAWFGLGALLHRPYAHQRQAYLEYLEKNGIENRPIISGNFIRQPCIVAFCEGERPENYPGAETIHTRGFFIGIHQIPLAQVLIGKLVDIMLGYSFSPRQTVLILPSHGIIGRNILNILKDTDHQITREISVQPERTSVKCIDAEWIFPGHYDEDLRKRENVITILKRFQPTHVLYCASYIDSREEMVLGPFERWIDQVTISNNILKTARESQAWIGPVKVVSVLPSIFHDNTQISLHPFVKDGILTNSDIKSCPYFITSLFQLTKWYRDRYGCNFVSILTGDVFGPYGNFSADASSLVHSVIKNQLVTDASSIQHYSQSIERRKSIIFARDLSHILIWATLNYNSNQTLLASGEETSMAYISQLVRGTIDSNVEIGHDHDSIEKNDFPEQLNVIPIEVAYPNFRKTTLSEAIHQTIEWYQQNKF